MSDDAPICRSCGHELARHSGPTGPCCHGDMDPETMGCSCVGFEPEAPDPDTEGKATCSMCSQEGSLDLALGDCIYSNEPHCEGCCRKEYPPGVPHRWKPFPENF